MSSRVVGKALQSGREQRQEGGGEEVEGVAGVNQRPGGMQPVRGAARRPAVAGAARGTAGGSVRSHGDQVTEGFTPWGHPKGLQTPLEQNRNLRL